MSLWGNPEKDTEKNVSKLAKANLVFKPESHCKSIVSRCKSTGRSEGFTVNGEQKTWKSVSSSPKI